MDIIIDTIEDVDNLFDNSFKNELLNKFSRMEGTAVVLSTAFNKTMYAFLSDGQFYISLMEDVSPEKVHFKIFKIPTFGELLKVADEILPWDKDNKINELIESFRITH